MPHTNDEPQSQADQVENPSNITSNDLSVFVESLEEDFSDSVFFTMQALSIRQMLNFELDDYNEFCRKIIKVLPEDDNEYRPLSEQEKNLGSFHRIMRRQLSVSAYEYLFYVVYVSALILNLDQLSSVRCENSPK